MSLETKQELIAQHGDSAPVSKTEETNEAFIAAFEAMQSMAFGTAFRKGWWDQCLIEDSNGHEVFDPELRNSGEAIALMHSELSEALEADRNNIAESEHIPDFSGLEEEFADVIIRIMDFSKANKLRTAEAVAAKMAFNDQRENKHGGKKY